MILSLSLVVCRFIMITYLHHTDPKVPHYRKAQWNYQRGAAATVDRRFLGWLGRFFLHDVAHYHVIHHFFPKMPFCKVHLKPRSNFELIQIFARSWSRSYRIPQEVHGRPLSLFGRTRIQYALEELQRLPVCR